jgi:hypothetical protein
MADRRLSSQSSTTAELRGAVAGIPEPERSVIEMDLPRIQRWLRGHPDIRATVAPARTAFDAGQGHVLLVVTVKGDRAAVRVSWSLSWPIQIAFGCGHFVHPQKSCTGCCTGSWTHV